MKNETDINDFCPHIIAVVGATGVGKTSAIARFVERIFDVRRNDEIPPSIKIVSLDSRREKASEQTSLFADSLKIPVVFVMDSNEFYKVLNDSKAKNEYVFIDTQGCSLHDKKMLNKIKRFLLPEEFPGEILLAISMSSSLEYIKKNIRFFKPLKFNSVLLTKIDECSGLGMLSDFILELGSEISWMTEDKELCKIEKINLLSDFFNEFEWKREEFFDAERLNVLGKEGWEVLEGNMDYVLFRRYKSGILYEWEYKWISLRNDEAKKKYSKEKGWLLAMWMPNDAQAVIKKRAGKVVKDSTQKEASL